jgi:hypothetical protein
LKSINPKRLINLPPTMRALRAAASLAEGGQNDCLLDAGVMGLRNIPSETGNPLKIWREWAPRVIGQPANSGTFPYQGSSRRDSCRLDGIFPP